MEQPNNPVYADESSLLTSAVSMQQYVPKKTYCNLCHQETFTDGTRNQNYEIRNLIHKCFGSTRWHSGASVTQDPSVVVLILPPLITGATQWCSWFRHCATSWKAAGSNHDGVTLSFQWHNPSSCTMALGLTQSLTEVSTRNISLGVMAAGA